MFHKIEVSMTPLLYAPTSMYDCGTYLCTDTGFEDFELNKSLSGR